MPPLANRGLGTAPTVGDRSHRGPLPPTTGRLKHGPSEQHRAEDAKRPHGERSYR